MRLEPVLSRGQDSSWRSSWLLDPDVVYLNHGSFGACPREVLEFQTSLRDRLEREPISFLGRQLEGMLDDARKTLADFIGAGADGLAFVPNATTAVNTVLRSIGLRSGDEILITDHEYNACKNAAHVVADETGSNVVTAAVPFPLASPDDVGEALVSCVTERTRVCLIDHITSPTALVFPIARLVRELRDREIPVLVDGAHGPGMVPLKIADLGADFYTGNCHKWLCTPKGSAFLWVSEPWRTRVHPLVTSHGARSERRDRSRFQMEFDWVGTDDPTAYLSTPKAIEFLGSLLPGGWKDLMKRNREMVLDARKKLCACLGIPLPCPDEMIGSIASAPLPEGTSTSHDEIGPHDPLYRELVERHRIEVAVFPWPRPPKRVLRISAQIYNSPREYDLLTRALGDLLGRKQD